MNNNNDLEKIAKSSRRYGIVSMIGVIILMEQSGFLLLKPLKNSILIEREIL